MSGSPWENQVQQAVYAHCPRHGAGPGRGIRRAEARKGGRCSAAQIPQAGGAALQVPSGGLLLQIISVYFTFCGIAGVFPLEIWEMLCYTITRGDREKSSGPSEGGFASFGFTCVSFFMSTLS